MADYATHANRAQEILDGLHIKTFQRQPTLGVAAAQVHAILALAAAIERNNRSDEGRAG
jgi:hypothetical protein